MLPSRFVTGELQSPPNAEAQASSIDFVGFVVSLARTAAVHFGDIADPFSGAKTDANLAAAQQMIDILALLDEKTRGNLTAEECQLLDRVLTELRARLVEVQRGAPEAPVAEPASRIIRP